MKKGARKGPEFHEPLRWRKGINHPTVILEQGPSEVERCVVRLERRVAELERQVLLLKKQVGRILERRDC